MAIINNEAVTHFESQIYCFFVIFLPATKIGEKRTVEQKAQIEVISECDLGENECYCLLCNACSSGLTGVH